MDIIGKTPVVTEPVIKEVINGSASSIPESTSTQIVPFTPAATDRMKNGYGNYGGTSVAGYSDTNQAM